jgi:hypothetical protein
VNDTVPLPGFETTVAA